MLMVKNIGDNLEAATSVRHNIVANFAGSAWTSIISLVFIPFFIKLIGVEAYGLIGIFASLTALFAVLDMGLSSTLSRELSRLSAMPDSEQEARDLVRTLETVYWGVGVLIGIAVVLLAPLIARYWVNPQGVTVGTVETAIMIMGLTVAFQWPSSLYAGGLMGLQRQVLLNVVRVVMVTIQYGGAVLVLWLISPTILTFFVWQFFIGVASTLVLTVSLWKALSRCGLKARFNVSLLKKNWRFAAGMTGISALVTILTQLDKIILSKMLTLEVFGYYTLAINAANTLTNLVNPIFSAFFPKFSQLVAEGEHAKISSLYHKGCQLVSIIILPVAATLVFFSNEILLLWIRDPVTVANTNILFSILVVGTAINTLMVLPYSLQLAYGLTRLVLIQNIVSVALLIPLMIWMVNRYGSAGAAVVWIILNMGYLFILIPIMHRQLLKAEMWRWYSFDVALPVIIIFIVTLCARILLPAGVSMNFTFLWISLSYLAGLFSLAWTLPITRKKINSVIFRNNI